MLCRLPTAFAILLSFLSVFADFARGQADEATVTFSRLRDVILDDPDVAALHADPRRNVHKNCSHFDVMGVRPDISVVDGQRVAVVNVWVCFRVANAGVTCYGIGRAEFQPTVVDGHPALKFVEAGIADMRPADSAFSGIVGQFADVEKIMEGSIHRTFPEKVAKAGKKLADEATNLGKLAGGRANYILLHRDGITFASHPPPRGHSAIEWDFGYDDGLPSGPCNHEWGDKNNAVLVVDLFFDHLQYYRATQLFRQDILKLRPPPADSWPVNDGGMDSWLLETGLFGVTETAERLHGQLPGNAKPGSKILRLYLAEGDKFANIRKLAGHDGWGWENRIGSIVIRPGPRYAGHSIRVFDRADFKDGRSQILGIDYHCLRNGEKYKFDNGHYLFSNGSGSPGGIDSFMVVKE